MELCNAIYWAIVSSLWVYRLMVIRWMACVDGQGNIYLMIMEEYEKVTLMISKVTLIKMELINKLKCD